MPCCCWYHPSDESKRLIKSHLQIVVDQVKRLEANGDPVGLGYQDVVKLFDHMYSDNCDEKPKKTEGRHDFPINYKSTEYPEG